MKTNFGEQDHSKQRIYRLAQAAILGDLSADDAKWLEEQVASDATSCDIYTSFILDTVVLSDFAAERITLTTVPLPARATSANDEAIPPVFGGGVSAASRIGASDSSSRYESFASNHHDLVSKHLPSGVLPVRLRRSAALVVLATTLSVAALLGVFWPDVPAADQGDPAMAKVAEQEGAGNGSSIVLEGGTTRLFLPRIGHVIIEGPADFKLTGPMRARLSYGRIKMRVTERTGQGFVIETPDGEVTDLGTEFALNVSDGKDSSLIVREGMVDLRVGTSPQLNGPQRLMIGDGVTFEKGGKLDRVMSIVSTDSGSFETVSSQTSSEKLSLIKSVTDSLHSSDTKKFYEIVPGGLHEDAPAYVDRDYQWNGWDAKGIPDFLVGAEYVRTFNDYKRRTFTIELELARPADVYVFWDERVPHAKWLRKDFTNTGFFIGIDESPAKHSGFKPGELGVGPGEEVDNRCSIWQKSVPAGGVVNLGGVNRKQSKISMYGIAVTEIGAGVVIEPERVESPQ